MRIHLFILALATCLPAAARIHAAEPPSIVVIMSDDMGFSDIGCYGGEIQTPNLDALAAGGLRFTQFYNTSRCCPTRAALLSGVYQHQAGVGLMTEDNRLPGYRGELGCNVMTVGQVMRRGGYRTYMAGKWHVTRSVQPQGPKNNWTLQRGLRSPSATAIRTFFRWRASA